ncbi:acyltransferase family protein [Nocardia sp. NPDC056100]|uniref:acyltransferase family protein n=1 Tax=Nocardia sp. NPDC056100 TaxID=3345712 RepID=UPI0035E14B4D
MTTSDKRVTSPVNPVEGKVRTRGGRFEFLDALRGVAALAVVIEHCSVQVSPAYERFSITYFGAGVFGVFVFFITSGFIIPASLERGRSLGAFWVGRFFRLYPLFWICLIVALILHAVRAYGGPPGFLADPAANILTNFSMAHFFLVGGYSQMLVVAWTLSYELVFYMIVSLLFVAGLNRRSVPLAVLAIGSIPLAELFLPSSMIGGSDATLTTRLTVAIVTVLVAVCVAQRAATKGSAVAAVVLASIAIPLLLNQPGPSGYSATIFATMFVGTVLYRMTADEISAALGWAVFVLAGGVIVGLELLRHPVPWNNKACTLGAAYLLFAVALLLRRRSFPRPLLFLGRISYSLYLVHALAINFLPKWPVSVIGIPAALLTWITWVLGSIAIAALTYHKIEKPALALGHRLIGKMAERTRAAA